MSTPTSTSSPTPDGDHHTQSLEIYLVGGAVRDALLGREVHDRDWVVVGSTAEEMLARGFTQVGRDFPVFLHPITHEEYALARTERKQGSGHGGFAVHAAPNVTLEEDLLRRDLTINAMAQDAQGHIVDPFGGEQHLHERRLCHVSAAFSEDPLRVMRVARFAAQLDGFVVADDTLALMRDMCAGDELQTLSAERVWQEFAKALQTPGVSRFIEVLASCTGLHQWFVELSPLLVNLLTAQHRTRAVQATGIMRFAHLGLELDELQSLTTRLKSPQEFAQAAADQYRFGATLLTWRQCDVERLVAALDGLRAWQDRARLEQAIQVASLGLESLFELSDTEIETAQTQLLVLGDIVAELVSVKHEVGEARGKAYGEAVRAARIAWLARRLATE